jgi:hypothetical protein
MADGSLADLVNPWAESGSTHQVPVPLPERADPVVNLSDGSARDRSPVDPDVCFSCRYKLFMLILCHDRE